MQEELVMERLWSGRAILSLLWRGYGVVELF